MCKPALPVVKDIVAHLFWKMEHLATVHHHYGKNHVHNEIKDVAAHDEKQNNQQTKTQEPVSIHILSKNNYDLGYQFISANSYSSKLYRLLNPFLEIKSPPPKS